MLDKSLSFAEAIVEFEKNCTDLTDTEKAISTVSFIAGGMQSLEILINIARLPSPLKELGIMYFRQEMKEISEYIFKSLETKFSEYPDDIKKKILEIENIKYKDK